jgi:hypothetical protein
MPKTRATKQPSRSHRAPVTKRAAAPSTRVKAPTRSGEEWRVTFDGDPAKSLERFQRLAATFQDHANAAMLNVASYHLAVWLSVEHGMHTLPDEVSRQMRREQRTRRAAQLAS